MDFFGAVGTARFRWYRPALDQRPYQQNAEIRRYKKGSQLAEKPRNHLDLRGFGDQLRLLVANPWRRGWDSSSQHKKCFYLCKL